MEKSSFIKAPHERTTRRIYGYFNDNNEPVYIGSSYCKLSTLEYNHRNWRTKYAKDKNKGWTSFRENLTDTDLKNGVFKTILEINGITQLEIEDLEGQLIRVFKPKFNKDKFPVQSSIDRKRYDENSLAVPV